MNAISSTPWPNRRRRHFSSCSMSCGWSGCPRGRGHTTHAAACQVLYLVNVMGWTQTRAANELGLNQGTVSRIVRGLWFPNAGMMPMCGARSSSKGTQGRQGNLF